MIERRRYMGSKGINEKSYIQDGLIFQLDGINKGSDPDAWTDLVKGIQFPTSTTVVHNDCVEFSSSSDVVSTTTVGAIFPISSCHLEVIMTDWNTSTSALVFILERNSQIACGFLGSNNVLGATSGATLKTFVKPVPSTSAPVLQFSYNNTEGYYKGRVTERGTPTYWGTSKDAFIRLGKRKTGNNYTGKIYSIRVYDRHLTEDEVLHNYLTDKQRFNI